jgi:hypothetical protein
VWVWLQVIAGAAVIIAVWRFALQAPPAPPAAASIARVQEADREPQPVTKTEPATPAPQPAETPSVDADSKTAQPTVAASPRTVATPPKPAPTATVERAGDDSAPDRKPTAKRSPPTRVRPAVAPRDANVVVDAGTREARPRKPTPTPTVEPPPRGDEPDDVAVRWNRANP